MRDLYEERPSGLLVPAPASVRFAGRYDFKQVRKGHVIDEWSSDNIVVNQGLNAILNIVLGAQSAITTWYLGLFSGNYTPVAADTASSISTNATETTVYSAGVRQTFVPAAATVQSISNSASQASFTFTASASIYGAFLVSTSAINGTSGYLMSASQFGSVKNVSNADQLLVSYTFNAASTS